jgi:hypothetical protein
MSNEPVVTRYTFPSEDLESALRRVAATHGVQDVYWDIWGREHRPGADIQQAVLRAVGVDVTSLATVDESLREWLRRERLALLPSCVVSADSESWLPVAFAAGADGATTLTVALEDGGVLESRARLVELAVFETVEVDGAVWSRARLPLPEGLPHGYHKATLVAGGVTASCELIHCPDRVFRPEAISADQRLAGIAISL